MATMERGNMRELGPRNRLKEVYYPKDDWTGKASASERRKLQNRLHQRAWRRRKAAEKASSRRLNDDCSSRVSENEAINLAFKQATAVFMRVPPSPPAIRVHADSPITKTCPRTPDPTPIPLNLHDLMGANLLIQREASPETTKPSSSSSHNESAPPVIRFWETHQLSGRVPPDSTEFPLAPDHYLITLIQFNVLRGLVTNVVLCSGYHELPLECQMTLTLALSRPATPPPIFKPTALQSTTPHPSWIDSVPCAKLRDNLVTATTTEDPRLDGDDLCDDMCGGLYDGIDDCEKRGMLIWGEPWKIESWEMSEGFLEKWGWLLRGCGEMMDATNRWRDIRGEERLAVEVE